MHNFIKIKKKFVADLFICSKINFSETGENKYEKEIRQLNYYFLFYYLFRNILTFNFIKLEIY